MNNYVKIFQYILVALLMITVSHAFSYQVLSTNPAPLQAGEYADVTVRIDSFRGEDSERLENVKLSLKETDFIKPVPGQEVSISSIETGQSITRTFRVYFSSSIPTGEIPLVMNIESSGLSREQTDSVFVQGGDNEAKLEIGTAQTVPDKIIQDSKSNEITVVLQNLGQKAAEQIRATLNTQNSALKESYSYSLEDTTSSIQPGGETPLSFTFDVDETQSIHQNLTLDLRYRTLDDFNNTYRTVETTLPLNLQLAETPWFEVVDVEKQQDFVAGTSGNELKLTVENTGLEEGKNVRLRLYPDPSAPFDFERTSIFITSTIKEDETASFLIPFDILDDALAQSYYVNADFESLVGETRYTQSTRVEIDVDAVSGRGLELYIAALVILSLLVAVLIGFFHNRRKQ